MKFNKSISAVIIGLSLSMMTANPVQWVDRIVVVVNNDVITQRDIEDISTRIARSLPKMRQVRFPLWTLKKWLSAI